MKLKFLIITLILIMTTGCSSINNLSTNNDSPSLQEESGRDKIINVGLSFASKEDVIYQAFEDYLVNAGKLSKPLVRFTVKVADWNTEKQASDIKELINEKMDLIVMMPQDSKAITVSIKAVHAAGIPVITYNRAATPFSDEKADAHVGLDTVDQAYTTAMVLFELMQKDGVSPKIINIMGDLRDENAVNRNKGLKKAADERGIDIVQQVTTDWNADKANAGLLEALKKNPGVNALFVASDVLMPGVKSALQSLDRWEPYGKEKHIYIGSQDVNPFGAELLKAQYVDVSTAFDIWPMSLVAVDTINKLIQKKPVSKQILIKGRILYDKNIMKEQNVWANDYKYKVKNLKVN